MNRCLSFQLTLPQNITEILKIATAFLMSQTFLLRVKEMMKVKLG